MVLAERNTDLVRNGRRSRGPSPNGHGSGGGSSSIGNVGGNGGGTVTPDSSDDDNSIKRNGKSKTKQSEYEEKIRVGRDYQAVCPPLIPEQERKPEVLNDRALLVWSPTKEIPDSKLEEYISVAKEKYGYNGEQALGMLFWHKHDLERAVMDLANFTPFPDEWTVEDRVLFEQAFQFHGKSFHRIRQMLPDKSIASLVKYYYSWKKTRHRQSVMDRQEKAKASKEGSENGSENGSNEESDNDDKDQVIAPSTSSSLSHDQLNAKAGVGGGGGNGGLGLQGIVDSNAGNETGSKSNEINDGDNESSTMSTPIAAAAGKNSVAANIPKRQETPPHSTTTDSSGGRSTPTNNATGAGGNCTNCGVACHFLNSTPVGKFCFSCYNHWRRTGNKRPTSGPCLSKRSRDFERNKRKPPRGMSINHDDIVTLASAPENEDKFIANIDREIVSLLTQVQINKKTISALKKKNSESTEDLRAPDNTNRINPRFTNDEVLMGVECVRKFGKDFQAIAETLGTKTESQVKVFYSNYRRRYNLDQLAKQHEAKKEAASAAAAVTPNAAGSSSTSNSGSATSNEIANTASAAISTNINVNKKEDPKKKDAPSVTNAIVANDESDNTNSSETTASKSVHSETKNATSYDSNNAGRKDNIVLEVQTNKKTISALKKKDSESTEDLRSPENTNRINPSWTNEDVLMGVECVRKFGKDFQAIAETLGTKTESQVKVFYSNYRRRYNLDQLAKQHEAEKEAAAAAVTSNAAGSSSTSNRGPATSDEIANATSATASTSMASNVNVNKKDDPKKKQVVTVSNTNVIADNDESDNTNSSETTASKSVHSETKNINSYDSNNAGRKDNIVIEIDLDAEQSDEPPSKKYALAVGNQDFPKSNAV